MEKNVRSRAVNIGLLMGLSLALITIICYVIDLSMFTSLWLMLINFIIILGFGIFSAAGVKKVLGGFASFKQVFTSYTITMALGLFISTAVGVVLFNFIDPEAAQTIKELSIQTSVEWMEKFGAPESQIEQAVAAAEEQDQMGIGTQLTNYVFFLAFMLVIGLLVSLIFKKKDPNTV